MNRVDYDRISEIYDLVRTGDPQVIGFILDKKDVKADTKILEVGCGSGNNTVLMKAASEAEVYGLDQSKGMLEKAKVKDGSIHFYLGDAVLLEGFQDESLDIVYMVDVIHHIKDIGSMFRNIYRVLKRDGMVFIFTDTHERIREERITSKYFPETVSVELERYQPTEQMLYAMKSCGLKDIRLEKLEYEEETDMGEYLIKVAQTKGYSMFHLIPEAALERGIQRIRQDMKKGKIAYKPNTPVFLGRK
ncbi:MAG: class I SAM-dependent methyltransferase [Pseudomonadota bacterium]